MTNSMPMRQGNGGNHRIGQADRLPGAFEVAPDVASKLRRGLIKLQDILGADMSEQVGDLLWPLDLLKPLDHLHHGDHGEG